MDVVVVGEDDGEEEEGGWTAEGLILREMLFGESAGEALSSGMVGERMREERGKD